MFNGIIIVNKEANMTSRDVVNKISRIINTKKVGHTGTLDPLAKGVLVIVFGKYTKLCDVLTSEYKEYIATMQLGLITDTYDITGNIIKENVVSNNEEEIIRIIMSYQKKYNQQVPIYSAVKVNGKKLYEYARNGLDVEIPSKEVDIKSIEIISIKDNIVTFKTTVSKGTYIRSLINDIGESLGCGATMTDLIRTKQGKFAIEESFTVEDIASGNYQLLDLEDILELEIVNNYSDINKIKNGCKITFNSKKEFLLFVENDKKIALYRLNDKYYEMFIKLF